MNSKTSPINSKLSGQVAVVTGGGRGIGRAIAATLSEARRPRTNDGQTGSNPQVLINAITVHLKS